MYSVYRIKNTVNGKSYIGITSRSVRERFEEHLSRCRNYQRGNRLYIAMRKYGAENFKVELLGSSSDEDAIRNLETENIKKFDSYKNGYNCNLGGCGFLEFPENIRKKIRIAQKGKTISLEAKTKMSAAKKGNKNCAKNFGDYTQKGYENPKSKCFSIQFPDGHIETIQGLRAFCREHNLSQCSLSARGKNKGFVLLERFNDQGINPIESSGSKRTPTHRVDDMV